MNAKVNPKPQPSCDASRPADAPAWDALVQRNLPLVKYVLSKVARNLPPSVDRDDLLSAGSLGLTEAARRYDPSRNVPFHSYAIPRIWGAMLDELRSHDRLSADLRSQVNKCRSSLSHLQQAGNALPTVEEVAGDLGYSVERVARLIHLARTDHQASSTDASEVEVGEEGLRAHLGLRAPRGPYEEVEFEDQKRALARAIAELPQRERQVIVLRYHEELLLHEIGEMMNITESRVCQIHTQALTRLRTALHHAGLGVA